MSARAALAELAHGLEVALGAIRKLQDAPDPEAWIDQTTSPLGRRRHCILARRGVLNAHKDGARWLVRRRDLDSYIEGQAVGQGTSEAADVAAVLAFRGKTGRAARR